MSDQLAQLNEEHHKILEEMAALRAGMDKKNKDERRADEKKLFYLKMRTRVLEDEREKLRKRKTKEEKEKQKEIKANYKKAEYVNKRMQEILRNGGRRPAKKTGALTWIITIIVIAIAVGVAIGFIANYKLDYSLSEEGEKCQEIVMGTVMAKGIEGYCDTYIGSDGSLHYKYVQVFDAKTKDEKDVYIIWETGKSGRY